VGIGGSFFSIWIGVAAYVVVALVWLVPDRRAERFVNAHLVQQD
jgi:membrane protein implicated in regulation of membrane protease activity